MLAGHPRLFAAPELQLLGFNRLKERREAFDGRFSAWLEGAIRALMELEGCGANEAKRLMGEFESQDLTTKQFYALLQDKLGARILVDKSPSYALDPAALRKAEADFHEPFYVHLVRHPHPMVRSFEKIHMDQVLYLDPHPFSARQLGELVWTVSHQNIVEFLDRVPKARKFRVRFEDLVRTPGETLKSMLESLGLDFHPGVLQPYKDSERKMTDGIYADSTPMGDVKFHRYHDIEPAVADRWQRDVTEDFLGDVTWELAESLGYERMTSASSNLGTSASGRSRRDKMRALRKRRQAG